MCDEPTDPAKVAEREFVVELLEDAAELFGLTVVVEEQCTAPGGGDAHAQRIALSTNDGGSAASYANQDGAPQMFMAATNAPAQKVGMGDGVIDWLRGCGEWPGAHRLGCGHAMKRRSAVPAYTPPWLSHFCAPCPLCPAPAAGPAGRQPGVPLPASAVPHRRRAAHPARRLRRLPAQPHAVGAVGWSVGRLAATAGR